MTFLRREIYRVSIFTRGFEIFNVISISFYKISLCHFLHFWILVVKLS